ncbi:MAG: glycosyltransferase, partial [Coriobacteriales bacterium]|nr:glycosyltransferase [Coriobacteriales bacterium]
MAERLPKASVIIPVYNAERYLEECLDGVLGQTLRDIEVICVNDGSTDGSRSILARYARADSRVVLIDKENGGQSSARNAGLGVARGSYVSFLDSDDYQAPELLELCCAKAEESSLDLVFFDARTFFESDEMREAFAVYDGLYLRKGSYEGVRDGRTLFGELRAQGDYRESVCLSLYRRGFLTEQGLRFIEGIIHEDDVFTFSALLGAQRVQHIPRALYHRRIRSDSTVTAPRSRAKFWGKAIGQLALLDFLARKPGASDPATAPAAATGDSGDCDGGDGTVLSQPACDGGDGTVLSQPACDGGCDSGDGTVLS